MATACDARETDTNGGKLGGKVRNAVELARFQSKAHIFSVTERAAARQKSAYSLAAYRKQEGVHSPVTDIQLSIAGFRNNDREMPTSEGEHLWVARDRSKNHQDV